MKKFDFEIVKIARGEYQVIRADGTAYFPFPVSKLKASQAIQDEQVHARLLADARINKAVHKYIDKRGIKIESFSTVDTFIYQYSYRLDHKEMRGMIRRPALFIKHIDKTMASDKAARLASILPAHTDAYKHCNHHHELTNEYELVNYGDGEFVANKAAIPLLKALNEAGLKTRTHHYTGEGDCFVSVLLDSVRIEVKEVNEIDADRTKYNGLTELLIMWTK